MNGGGLLEHLDLGELLFARVRHARGRRAHLVAGDIVLHFFDFPLLAVIVVFILAGILFALRQKAGIVRGVFFDLPVFDVHDRAAHAIEKFRIVRDDENGLGARV